MKKNLLLAIIVFLFSSCGIYNSYKPVDTVPENLYGTDSILIADESNFGNTNWRMVFTDPYLQDLIELGLNNNTDYRSAQLRVEEAEATLLSAKLSFLPAFTLSPQGGVSSFDQQKPSWTYTVPITASWELDIFGRMRNAKKQAQALYEQSKDYQQAVRSRLISGIANTYYTLLMLDEQLNILQQTEKAWEETVFSARALMEAGQYDEAGVSQIEGIYYNVQTSICDVEEQINQVENSLSLLLAETPHSYERGKLSEQILPEEFSTGIPIQLLSNRPDVRMAEHAMEAAFYVTNQTRANFYPNIILSGSGGWTNAVGTIISNPGQWLFSAVTSLVQPLFNKGQNIANLRIAKAQQEEAQLAFQQTLLNAGTEVNEALVAYQTSCDKADLFEKQIEALRRSEYSMIQKMKYGNSTYLDVLTARQNLLNAELSQISNLFVELQSVVNLYQALGGGREV